MQAERNRRNQNGQQPGNAAGPQAQQNPQPQAGNAPGGQPQANAQAGAQPAQNANPQPQQAQAPEARFRVWLEKDVENKVVVNEDFILDMDARSLDRFVHEESRLQLSANEVLQDFLRTVRFCKGTPEEFEQAVGVSVKRARSSREADWTPEQEALFEMMDHQRADTLFENQTAESIEAMALTSGGKTPQDALAHLMAKFQNEGQRNKAIQIISKCYQAGIYAPIGSINSKDQINIANMIKFFELENITFAQKEMVARVFMILEIGSKNGFSLNHYVKATYTEVQEEDRFEANTNLLDYYFFERTNTLQNMYYWIKYAINHYDTVEAIGNGKKNKNTQKMPHKKNSDLKFDIYNAGNVEVNDNDYPWDEVNSKNFSQVCYFLAVRDSKKSIEVAAEALGAFIRRRIIAIIKAQNVDPNMKKEVRALQNFASRMKSKKHFWTGFMADNKILKISIESEAFTEDERTRALNIFKARFIPLKVDRNRRRRDEENDEEDEEDQFEDASSGSEEEI